MESRQLKICCTCHELTQALLRVVEMVVTKSPEVLTDQTRDSSEVLLNRLCVVSLSHWRGEFKIWDWCNRNLFQAY